MKRIWLLSAVIIGVMLFLDRPITNNIVFSQDKESVILYGDWK